MNTLIISMLHHSIPSLAPRTIAEEAGIGWHYRLARAIKKYSQYLESEGLRPSGDRLGYSKEVDGIHISLAPTIRPLLSERFWKWNEFAPSMVGYIMQRSKKDAVVPYIHEYRAFNSGIVIGGLRDTPMILQHHGSMPPVLRLQGSLGVRKLIRAIRSLPMMWRERFLKKVQGAIFVLNSFEARYLEKLGVNAFVKLRTMGVDYNEVSPVSSECEKHDLKRRLGLPEDAIILCTYLGVIKESFSTVKGAQHILSIFSELRKHFGNKVSIITIGIKGPVLYEWQKVGIMAHYYVPHSLFVDMIRASDLFILPATSAYFFGGIGVSVIESMAAGVPVISPTLAHFPEQRLIDRLGIKAPWCDDEKRLRRFIDDVVYAIENLGSFGSDVIREASRKYYSWEAVVRDIEDVVERIT